MGEGIKSMISVCMATYNGEKYIKQQIESILCQLSNEDELIISDDMSTDNTLNILKSFNDSRIKIYIHDKEHGFVYLKRFFQEGIKGDYIFLSDQDDIWMPDKVKISLDYLKIYDFVVSDCITINEKEQIISSSRIKDYNIKTGFWRLMIKTRYLGCCMAFNRKVLKTVLPFPANSYLMEHDLWIAAVSECYYKTALIPEALIKYRRHGRNASSGGDSKGYSLAIKIVRRLYRLVCLAFVRNKTKKFRKDK